METIWDDINLCKRSIRDDPDLSKIIDSLFNTNFIPTDIQSTFISRYYRKLLRAKLELDLHQKAIPKGIIITNFQNTVVDNSISRTLRNIRVICKYLGIENSISDTELDLSKFVDVYFWSLMAANFIELYGEHYVKTFTLSYDHLSSLENIVKCLHTIFFIWSGSTVSYDKSHNKIILKSNPTLKFLLNFLRKYDTH